MDSVSWLRDMSRRGGKGTVSGVDARALGRVADQLQHLEEERESDTKVVQVTFEAGDTREEKHYRFCFSEKGLGEMHDPEGFMKAKFEEALFGIHGPRAADGRAISLLKSELIEMANRHPAEANHLRDVLQEIFNVQ